MPLIINIHCVRAYLRTACFYLQYYIPTPFPRYRLLKLQRVYFNFGEYKDHVTHKSCRQTHSTNPSAVPEGAWPAGCSGGCSREPSPCPPCCVCRFPKRQTSPPAMSNGPFFLRSSMTASTNSLPPFFSKVLPEQRIVILLLRSQVSTADMWLIIIFLLHHSRVFCPNIFWGLQSKI